MTEQVQNKESKIKPILLKSLFILVILAIIIILAFAIIRFLPMVFSSLASVGNFVKSPFKSGVVLKVNETDLSSDEIFRLYFEYEPEESGYYGLSYDCKPNLSLSVANQNNTLECNREYRIAPNDEFIDLKATLNKENSYVESNINVVYRNREQVSLSEDSLTISVINQTGGDSVAVNDLSSGATISSQSIDQNNNSQNSNTQTIKMPTVVIPNSSTQTYSSSGELADLQISNARATSDTLVSFDVTNIGSQASGNWYFNYTIPNERVERSPLQMSLNPGGAMRLTLNFVDINSGNTVINIDPNNQIRENSETNNVATVYVRGDGGNSSYYNDYSYNRYDYDRNDDADLTVRNLEVGRMSGSRFVEDDEIDEDDDAAVRFEVVNIGGESTGTWRFEITNTPYDDDDDYRSGRQNSLRPGESRTITVEFENPDDGRYNTKVEVDSDDDVDEEKENNNTDTETLKVEK